MVAVCASFGAIFKCLSADMVSAAGAGVDTATGLLIPSSAEKLRWIKDGR